MCGNRRVQKGEPPNKGEGGSEPRQALEEGEQTSEERIAPGRCWQGGSPRRHMSRGGEGVQPIVDECVHPPSTSGRELLDSVGGVRRLEHYNPGSRQQQPSSRRGVSAPGAEQRQTSTIARGMHKRMSTRETAYIPGGERARRGKPAQGGEPIHGEESVRQMSTQRSECNSATKAESGWTYAQTLS